MVTGGLSGNLRQVESAVLACSAGNIELPNDVLLNII